MDLQNSNNNGSNANTTSALFETYNYITQDLRDPRVDGWLLMNSVWPTVGFCVFYYLTVRVFGPAYMKNREPYELKTVMLVYNFLQVVFNMILLYKVWWLWRDHYNWQCQPVDYSNSYTALAALDVTYYYYLSKFFDFFDSFFFVLRKKFGHLSTLHVVHHGGLPIFVWLGPKFVGGGHTTFCGFLNSGIHVMMYLYYFLAALGPKVQPYLWWKKYLTRMQMIQFVVFVVHALQPLFTDCNYPLVYCYIILGHGLLYFSLFLNFYIQSYVKKQKTA